MDGTAVAWWGLLVWMAAARPMQSPAAFSSLDSELHQFHDGTRGTVAWSTELVRDFQVLYYERSSNAIAGYQRSTGRVFAQRSAQASGSPAVRHDDAVILSAPSLRADAVDTGSWSTDRPRSPCRGLTAVDALGGDPSRWPETSWQRLLPADEHGRAQTWTVRADTGSGVRRMRITSNVNSVLSCECDAMASSVLWRAVPAVWRAEGCRPSTERLPSSPHARLESRRARFCREMATALAHRALLAVDAHVLAAGGGGASASLTAAECWTTGLAAVGRAVATPAQAMGMDTVRPPRAVVLADAKQAIRTLVAQQALVSSVLAGLRVAQTWALDVALQASRVHPRLLRDGFPPRTDVAALREELRDLSSAGAEQGGVALAVPPYCDAADDPLLRALLQGHQVAAFTPESANTTRLGFAYAAHVAQVGECSARLIRVLTGHTRCLEAGNAGENLAGDGGAEDETLRQALRELETARGARRAQHGRERNQQMIDVADAAADAATAAVGEMSRHVHLLAKRYAAAIRGVEARHSQMASPGVNVTREAGELAVDIWCCGTRPAAGNNESLVTVTTPCQGFLHRLVQRAL